MPYRAIDHENSRKIPYGGRPEIELLYSFPLLPLMEEIQLHFESEHDRQLFALELKVAQRADELTRLLQIKGQAFELWRQAESEILFGQARLPAAS